MARLLLALLATTVYIALGLVPRVTLINMPKAESPTYWQRTRDSWIVGTITGLIGTLVGIGIGYVLPK